MARLKSVSRLEGHLGFWLRLVSNEVSRAFAARIEAKGVTVAEWVMLRSLYGTAPEAPSRLADTLGMTRGGVTKLADRLIGRGLIRRRPDPGDARAQILSLTAVGERLVPELADLADANDRAFFGALTPAERNALEVALRKLAATLGKSSFPTD